MQTIGGIETFMSMTDFLLSRFEHEEKFYSLTTLLICCDGRVLGVHIGSFVDAGLIFPRFLVKVLNIKH